VRALERVKRAMRYSVAALITLLSVIFSAAPSRPAFPAPPASAAPVSQDKPKNRLFPPQDLGKIEPADREQWQQPELIFDALIVADGAAVADLGAAGGWFTLRLARRVGPNGVVYAEDVQPEMLEAIRRRAQREGLTNIVTVLGTATDPRLPQAGLDGVLIAGAFHEMSCAVGPSCEDPIVLLENVARALKPKGRLGILDWVPGDGGPGRPADERMDEAVVVRAARAAGFELIKREQLQFQYLLVFGKATRARVTR
jgi:ubiquinone/menaquinone biosynthesis C-methylase UbiE